MNLFTDVVLTVSPGGHVLMVDQRPEPVALRPLTRACDVQHRRADLHRATLPFANQSSRLASDGEPDGKPDGALDAEETGAMVAAARRIRIKTVFHGIDLGARRHFFKLLHGCVGFQLR